MNLIPEFIVLMNGEPIAYIIGGTVIFLCMKAARALLYGDKPADSLDIATSVEEWSFKNKK